MQLRMRVAFKYSVWGITTVFAIYLGYITAQYLSFNTHLNFLNVKRELTANNFWMSTFYLHVTSGFVIIVLGPFQFLKGIRKKNIGLHRIIGKIYVFSILGIAAPTGLIMAFYAEGGIIASLGFAIMSFLWFWTTFKAVRKVINGSILEHEKWMYRSYALTLSAVTLRLLVPTLSLSLTSLSDLFIIQLTAWASWMINIILIEIYLLYKYKPLKNKYYETIEHNL